jgi:hypothetical protein
MLSGNIVSTKLAEHDYELIHMEELSTPHLTYRELTPEEFHLAPREVEHSEIFTPDNSRIIAAINEEGEVVSTWTLFLIPHAEPFWIRPDYRHHPSIIKHMAREMVGLFKELGFQQVYTIVLDNEYGKVLTRLAHWFGFSPIKGTLLTWKGDK